MDERCAFIGGKMYGKILVCLRDERPRKLVVKLKCEETYNESTRTLQNKDIEIGELNPEVCPKNQTIVLPFSIDIPDDFIQNFTYEKKKNESIFVTNSISLKADELSWPQGFPLPITLLNYFKPAPELPVFTIHT